MTDEYILQVEPSTKVLVLLDIDGVISPLPDPDRATQQFAGSDWRSVKLMGIPMPLRTELLWEITVLHQRPGVQVALHSSWYENGLDLLPIAGGPELPLAATAEEFNTPEEADHLWWKQRTIIRLLSHHPALHVVWADDDIDDFPPLADPRLHSLCPEIHTGLVPGMLTEQVDRLIG